MSSGMMCRYTRETRTHRAFSAPTHTPRVCVLKPECGDASATVNVYDYDYEHDDLLTAVTKQKPVKCEYTIL